MYLIITTLIKIIKKKTLQRTNSYDFTLQDLIFYNFLKIYT